MTDPTPTPETTFSESEVRLIIDEAIRQHVAEMFRQAMPRPISYAFEEEATRMVVLNEDLYMSIIAALPTQEHKPRTIEDLRQDLAAAAAENRATR